MKMKGLFVALLFFGLLQTGSFAAETKVVVHVKAKDAKFVGTSMAGARVVIRDGATGTILAEGKTSGGTGNTQKIMRDPWRRHAQLTDEKTANFTTTLAIAEPKLVTIEATGPLSQKQAAVTSSTQVWLIPGKNIDGDGIILELPGFAVDVIAPQNSQGFALAEGGTTISIAANVVMMCGCPVTSGGLWNADNYEVIALIKSHGETVASVPLHITEKTNTFAGEWTATQKGAFTIIVYAYDAVTGNTGVDAVTGYVR